MSADDFQVQFVQSRSGGSVAVGKIGSGPTLIVTPGSLPVSDFQHFRNLESSGVAVWIPALSEHFTCVTYDNQGAGLSTRDIYDYSGDGLYDEFEAVADKFGGAKSAVIGWGPASHAAIRYAVEHPDRVACLVITTSWSRGTQYTDTANFAAYRHTLETDWATGSEYYARVTLGLRGLEAQTVAAWIRTVTSLPCTWNTSTAWQSMTSLTYFLEWYAQRLLLVAKRTFSIRKAALGALPQAFPEHGSKIFRTGPNG